LIDNIKKRRTLHSILTIIILIATISSIPFSSKATSLLKKDDMTVTVGSIQGYTGQTVEVPVKVENQTEGIASYGMKFTFDNDALEIESIISEHGNANELECSTDELGCFFTNIDNKEGKLNIAWVDSSGGDHPINDEKPLFTIKVKIKSSSSKGVLPLTIDTKDPENLIFTNSDNKTINTTFNEGKLTILSPSSSAGPKVEEILVDVEGGKNNQVESVVKLPVKRSTESNGTVKDEVNFTSEQAQESLKKIEQLGGKTAKIVLPDQQDLVSEVKVNVPKNAVQSLSNKEANLELYTDSAKILIPNTSLGSFDDDLYFRMIPVKKEEDKQEIKQRALEENIVQVAAGDKEVKVLGRPMVIETNMENRPVTLTMPLTSFPSSTTEQTEMFKHLVVYIEHDDGTKEIVKGTLTDYKNGEKGISFGVNKFSTFTVLYMENVNEGTSNVVPTASKVKIVGSPTINATLKGEFSYFDKDYDVQGQSTFKWYRADNAKGTNKKVISGTSKSTYKLTSADKGKYIAVEVTPVAKTGNTKGKAVISSFIGPVKMPNQIPSAKYLKIEGSISVNHVLTAKYVYKDLEGDKEGKSVIKWYRLDQKTKKKQYIAGATKSTYKVTKTDQGQYIGFEVTPVAKTGNKTGKKVIKTTSSIVNQEMKGHFKLGVISNKAYVEKLANTIKKTYKGDNVSEKRRF